MLYEIMLTGHLIPCIVWIGSVFMGTYIDWPSARNSVKEGEFPFKFIIGQGSRVYFSVYFGITVLLITGIGLVYHHPPQTDKEYYMLAVKALCWLLMTLSTLYGTFSTWPKIQLATSEEAYEHYKWYMYRSQAVFILGIIAAVFGLWLYR